MNVANSDLTLTSTSLDCKNPSLDTTNARLGLGSVKKMQQIPLCNQSLTCTFTCNIYVSAKMYRLPFNKSAIATSSPF